MQDNKNEISVQEATQDEKHEDLLCEILEITNRIQGQSEPRSNNSDIEREARIKELVPILVPLRHD